MPATWYRSVSNSIFGSSKAWYRIVTYAETVAVYKAHGMDFAVKSVAEVGSGDEYFTAFHFLADKAERDLVERDLLGFSAVIAKGGFSAILAYYFAPKLYP